jgi:hypothetical protein
MATTFADHGTLVAATVTTVTLTSVKQSLRVQNRSTDQQIYYTYGAGVAADPTVAGDDTFAIPPGATDEWIDLGAVGAGFVVKLISAGTPAFSVEAW